MSKVVRSISGGLLVLVSVSAQGQSVRQAGETIRRQDCDSPTQPDRSYQSCALKLERTALRLASTGDVVAERGLVQPIPLAHFVGGGPAFSLAKRYERETRVGRTIQFIGASVAGVALAQRQWCPAKLCSRENHDALTNAMYAGVGILAVSVPIQLHARAKGRQAISIYNASLTR